jgi:protein-S-isoprenylcysteine O-methyltransferase Ste14
MIVHTLPLTGFLLISLVGIVWRAWLQYRRHGHTGLVLFRSANLKQTIAEALFVLLLLGIAAQSIAYAIAPGSLSKISILPPPQGGAWVVLGALLLFSGTALMVLAQLHLGASWRVGIDEESRPGLVSVGLYRYCRNPIFLGLFLGLAGFAVLIPSWLSVVTFLALVVGIRRQVLEEEAYLLRTYGEGYREYARRVGRFVPGIGVLA